MNTKKIRVDEVKVFIELDDNSDIDGAVGVYAKAQVSYPLDKKGNRRLEWLTSGGIWGIDDMDYARELAKGELIDLRKHLVTFGVDVSNFNKACPSECVDARF